jgi:hypothetical protein
MIISKPSPTLTLQFLLSLQGEDPGPLDGVSGPMTEKALNSFQTKKQLLIQAVGFALADSELLFALHDGLKNVGVLAVLKGLNDLGYTENPPNSNVTKFGDWFGRNGVPWCNIFVSYCLSIGAGYVLCGAGFRGVGVRFGKGCAYVPTTQNWLMANHLTVEPKSPAAGDIVIYAWDGKSPEHIGFACGPADSEGNFPSLEGNTSVNSDSNGGQVLFRTRNTKFVLALGRLG